MFPAELLAEVAELAGHFGYAAAAKLEVSPLAPCAGKHDAPQAIAKDRDRWVVSDLGHYLYAAVRRRAISQVRRIAVRRRAAPLLAEVAGGAGAPPDAEFDAEELWRRLERAIDTLPPRTRVAFMLSRREGLSYHEVAARMAISPKTVGVHIGRALSTLRKHPDALGR